MFTAFWSLTSYLDHYLINFLLLWEKQKIKQLVNKCGYAPALQTCSPAFPTAEQFIFTNVYCSDVEKIVSLLSRNKAPGIDKLPTRAIKDSAPGIIPSITAIINSSFTTSTFIRDWKIAEVSPILKEGDFEEPSGNRPISLLAILSKGLRKGGPESANTLPDNKQRLAVEQR